MSAINAGNTFSTETVCVIESVYVSTGAAVDFFYQPVFGFLEVSI